MTRIRKQSIIILLLVFVLGTLVSCKPEEVLNTSRTLGIEIGITDAICPNVIIDVGGQVTWTNDGRDEHIVRHVSQEGSAMFDSGVLTPGGSYTVNFPEPGVYSYICTQDGAVPGTVTVNP